MSRLHRHTILASLMSFFVACCAAADVASDHELITVNELNRLLDDPETVIVDVRSNSDWQFSEVKIKGAVRKAPKNFASWAYDYSKDTKLVLY